jgi:multimeric flavodoxin WrbA
MAKTVVIYHSGYGHTQRVAQFVAEGANAELIAIDADGNITDADWSALDAADAIIFGSPTYMGMASWQFKKFADASGKTKWPVALPSLPAPAATSCRLCSTSSLWPCNKPWSGWVSLP